MFENMYKSLKLANPSPKVCNGLTKNGLFHTSDQMKASAYCNDSGMLIYISTVNSA